MVNWHYKSAVAFSACNTTHGPWPITPPCLALAFASRWQLASLLPPAGLLRAFCFLYGIQIESSPKVGRQRHVDDDGIGAAEGGGGSGRRWWRLIMKWREDLTDPVVAKAEKRRPRSVGSVGRVGIVRRLVYCDLPSYRKLACFFV